jgi:hypothetical protein
MRATGLELPGALFVGSHYVCRGDTPECAEHYRELNAFLLHDLSKSGAEADR